MPATLRKEGDALILDLSTCRGSEFGDALDKIREVPGRQFICEQDPSDPSKEIKYWRIAATPTAADRILKTIQPDADDDVVEWVRESMMLHEESLTTPLPKDADLLLPWARKRAEWQPERVNDAPVTGLTDYQRAAVDHMAVHEHALVADDMGLGKTLEAIAAVEEWRLRNGHADGPKLVIAPSSVKGGWEREIYRWLGPDANVVIIKGAYGPRKAKGEDYRVLGISLEDPDRPIKLSPDQARRVALLKAIEDDAWIIVNWEQLRIEIESYKVHHRNGSVSTKKRKVMKEPAFEQTEWLAVIADEIHRAKNPNAQQTKGLHRVSGQLMFGLTGTPIMNHPGDLWSILAWMWPDEFHPDGKTHGPNATAYWDFYTDYVEYYEDHRHRKIVTGVKNPEPLRFVLKDKLIRRTSALLGLKGRKRIFYDLPLSPVQQKIYDEAETAMWLALHDDVVAGNKDAIKIAQAAVADGNVANLLRIPNGGARLTRLRQVIENPALIGGPDDSSLMDDFVEKFVNSESQWVYFCQYQASCELLAERLRKVGAEVGVFNGSYSPKVRSELEGEFQAGKIDAMVGTLDAMYQGVNLQSAHLMGFLSRSFVPVIDDQAEAREDRMGQKHQVMIYIPQPPGTVATGKVRTIARLKQSIEAAIINKDEIVEEYI